MAMLRPWPVSLRLLSASSVSVTLGCHPLTPALEFFFEKLGKRCQKTGHSLG